MKTEAEIEEEIQKEIDRRIRELEKRSKSEPVITVPIYDLTLD
jgi:helix-turn-helix protein